MWEDAGIDEVIRTTCPRDCYDACGVLVAVRGGKVRHVRGDLEQKDELKRRIEDASRYVDIEQLCLSPQCGFSSTVEGNALTEADQLAKLRLVVETAHEVWG